MESYRQLLCLVIFMSVVYGLHFLFPKKYRYLFLLVVSLGFIVYFSLYSAIFIVISAGSIYFVGKWMGQIHEKMLEQKTKVEKDEYQLIKKKAKSKKKLLVVLGIILNVGILFVLKYLNMFLSIGNKLFSTNISLIQVIIPLGISYYTLSAISYIVDCYVGKYSYEKNFFKVLFFLCYFPQLLEGPIARMNEVGQDLINSPTITKQDASIGIITFFIGLFKKIVIADRLSILVTAVFATTTMTGYIVTLGILAFTLQLYTEFSGIIDMVTGISRMYGFKLAKNFDHPFFSFSIGEFWRRWHISLGVWFKEYVFYPISMSKPMMKLSKFFRTHNHSFLQTFVPATIALFCVWFLTGLWHGASLKYVVYGLYYFLIILIETICKEIFKNKTWTKKLWVKVFQIIRMIILVNIGMLIFKTPTVMDAFTIFLNQFKTPSTSFFKLFDLKESIIALLSIIGLFLFEFFESKGISFVNFTQKQSIYFRVAIYFIFIMLIVIFGAYGEGYLPPDPIYGGF